MSEYVLQTIGLGKNFGSIVALNHVDFNIKPAEAVGIVGDNGAGKSTFIKTLSGAHKQSKGSIIFEDKVVEFNSPKDAIKIGIETVYQDLALAPHLDIASNIFLGREYVKGGLRGALGVRDRAAMEKRTEEVLDRLKIKVKSIRQPVGTLSGGQRQCVAIARAVAWGSKVVILDEPTAALGVEESRKVLDLIAHMKENQLSVILISHTMPHVIEACDRVCVFRLGESVTMLNKSDITVDELVMWITGTKTVEKSSSK